MKHHFGFVRYTNHSDGGGGCETFKILMLWCVTKGFKKLDFIPLYNFNLMFMSMYHSIVIHTYLWEWFVDF